MSFVKGITVIEDGSVKTVLGGKEKKKRKSSRGMRPFEKAARRMLEAGEAMTDEALDRHNRSSRKRKDGWARDMMTNAMKANQKALKKLFRF